MSKGPLTFSERELRQDGAEIGSEDLTGTLYRAARQDLELGKHQLNRVETGTVGRRKVLSSFAYSSGCQPQSTPSEGDSLELTPRELFDRQLLGMGSSLPAIIGYLHPKPCLWAQRERFREAVSLDSGTPPPASFPLRRRGLATIF